MKKVIMNEPGELYISAAELETANLNEWDRLEVHLLNQTVVVIPGDMTVMEIIRTAESLQGLAADLLAAIGAACEQCDGCNVEQLCDFMKGKIQPEVCVPPQVLEAAGWEPGCKLDCEVDPACSEIRIIEADHRYDLTDVPSTVLDTFRECGICLNDLEMKLREEVTVYRAEVNE